jgi:hypothetical protein
MAEFVFSLLNLGLKVISVKLCAGEVI